MPLTQIFCLIPAGDSIVTDRLYTAIAAGCLPVVISPVLPGAYPHILNYSRFWTVVSVKAFTRHPTALIEQLRAVPAAEVARRQRAMHSLRADLLFNVPGSRVATNFVRTVATTKCFRSIGREPGGGGGPRQKKQPK